MKDSCADARPVAGVDAGPDVTTVVLGHVHNDGSVCITATDQRSDAQHCAAAFAATSAIEAGEWDRHLMQISEAVHRRSMILNHNRKPSIPLPPGQVWVWMNHPLNRWEPRGTGVIIDERTTP